jgi:hypothetical protein
MTAHFKPGDCVIYRKQKFSVHPGPHAKDIRPAPYGDFYSYEVDKFWLVVAVERNNEITVRTRRGKHLTLNADDPALRRARWLERFLYRHRFPVPKVGDSPTGQQSSLP